LVWEQGKTPSSGGRRSVAVIGAGVSGLAAAKCLLDEGLEPVVYEQASQIGGLWNYDEALPDGGGVMYRSLRTNTSRHTLAFSDFPLPETTADFPSHSEVLQYLHDYAAHFGLHQHIHLNTVVESAQPTGEGRWTVCARGGEQATTETFEAMVVCSGRAHAPQIPQLPGSETFAGQVLHSSRYKGPEELSGQRIVVVGVGSSGVDIATELSKVAEHLYLSTEQGAWFIPRYVLNRPYDHQLTRLAERLPYRLRMFFFSRLLQSEYQRMGVTLRHLQAQGLPLPRFDLWSTRLTPCTDLLPRIQSGAIQVKPRIAQLEGQQVRFSDGSAVEADTIVSCTGYALRFPFLPGALLEIKQNSVELYKHVFHPDLPTLAFVGLCNVAGSAFPVAEIQGRWVARVLAGRMPLPSREDIHAAIVRYRTHPSHRSPVPMQVQLLEYVEDIASILGVRPHIWRHPHAAPRWFLGPFSAAHYRLDECAKKPGERAHQGSRGEGKYSRQRE
jgi:dimethylaniline monooxygenase (N-oxide forming) / hypotaurine monooxygenase